TGKWKRRAKLGTSGDLKEVDLEGTLVGRAGSSQELVHLEEVPDGYLDIESSTGNHAAASVVILPAVAEGVTYGVLELAFLGKTPPRAIELLERVAEGMGIAIRTTENRMRLRELFEESQRQSEELQTQQEELRVANEELEERSIALREAHAQVEMRQEELEVTNQRLEEQAHALMATQQDVIKKSTEVERASRYKSEFLANMSHELRTPLNSSLILSKLLADNKHGNLTEEQVKFASTIYQAGNDLLVLINDVLDLSKVEAGKTEVHAGAVPIERMTANLERTFEPVAKERGLAFAVSLEPGAPEVIETDSLRVEQILKNLISNALKFTDKGHVTLKVGPSDGATVRFRVEDTGIGIPEEHLASVFEAFRQVDATIQRKYGGTGLGLSIARDYAKLLGGDLAVESTPGKGSAFTLTLPLVYREPARDLNEAPRPLASSPRADVKPRLGASGRPSQVIPEASIADDRSALAVGKRTVLVVEDDVSFAQILVDLAHESGFQALVSHHADVGLAMARKYLPDAVLLDVNLPDHTGLSVLDRLKRDPATRHIPVHVVSEADHSQAALSMGALGYLIKPVKREDLKAAFEKLEERFSDSIRRLLIVEDDEVQRESLSLLLGGTDVEITAVGSVREALEALSSRTFDCVVTDLTLPDATGFELLEKMGMGDQTSFPPVIVYTGRSLTQEEETHLRKYSSSIIVKGARSPERLLDEVTLFLHRVESDLPPERRRMLKEARDR
ncbi:MAG: response regulator, partial [Polyangiaceae bacterium]